MASSRRFGVPLVVSGLLLVFALDTAHMSAIALEPPKDLRSTEEFADAQRFREGFHLKSDDDYVIRSLSDPAEFSNREDWGVPLTQSETAELARRVEIQNQLGEAAIWAAANATDVYGGMWIDQSRGGLPVVMLSKDAVAARDGIVGRVPDGINLEFREVQRSQAELEKTRDEINQAWLAGSLKPIPIVSTGIDTTTNTVLVGLEQHSPDWEAVLTEQFSVGLTFREDSSGSVFDTNNCYSDCAPPRVGGIGMFNVSHPTFKCTTGFVVKVTTGTDYFGVITAGHCFVVAVGDRGTNDVWRHARTDGTIVTLGTVVADTWYEDEDADVGLLRAASPPTSHRNDIVVDANKTYRNITHIAENAEQVIGDAICRFAWRTGLHCGVISVRDVTRVVSTAGVASYHIDHQWEVNFDADGGDSGGPYFQGLTAYGIHADSPDGVTAGRGWYSTLAWARATYNVRHSVLWDYCTTSAC